MSSCILLTDDCVLICPLLTSSLQPFLSFYSCLISSPLSKNTAFPSHDACLTSEACSAGTHSSFHSERLDKTHTIGIVYAEPTVMDQGIHSKAPGTVIFTACGNPQQNPAAPSPGLLCARDNVVAQVGLKGNGTLGDGELLDNPPSG